VGCVLSLGRRGRIDGVHIAYVAVCAAIVIITAFIPMFPVIGVGATMSAGMIIVPLVGIMLGPTAGTLATAVGAFLGQIVAPYGAIFGLITFLCPLASTATAAFLSRRKWKQGGLLVLMGILLWYLTTGIMWAGNPKAGIMWYFPFLHILSLVLVLVFRGKIGEWIASMDPKRMSIGIFLASLAGTLTEHMVGNSIYIGIYRGPPGPFYFVITIYWIERVLAAVGATVVGTPLLIGLKKARIDIGPWASE